MSDQPAQERLWTKDSILNFVNKRRRELRGGRASPDTAQHNGYLRAASVLAALDPKNLVPYGGPRAEDEGERPLAEELVELPGSRTHLKTLRPESRSVGLSSFSNREEMWRARQLNRGAAGGDLRDAAQRLFALFVRGKSFESDFVQALEGIRQRMLERIDGGESIVQLDLWSVLEPLQGIMGRDDGGRDDGGRDQLNHLVDAAYHEFPGPVSTPDLLNALNRPLSPKSQAGGSPAEQQAAIDWILTDSIPPLDSLIEPQIVSLLQAVRWFGDYLPGLPKIASLQRMLVRKRLLGRFERLATQFYGRVSELGQLREYVGALEPRTKTDAISRGFRAVFGSETAPPLMLHGMGGIGKSSLLSKFILEHLQSDLPFPFVYLDFDNRFLDVEDISTLVSEALAQLEMQYPEAARVWEGLRLILTELSERLSLAESPAPASPGSASGAETMALLDAQMNIEESLADALSSALLSGLRSNLLGASGDGLPFVLVLDTFEEVQRRSEKTERLWSFIARLQTRFPRLRLIVSGRAAVPQLLVNGQRARDMPLGPFDLVAATAILTRLGVTDPAAASALYKQVGGNPLSLRLAAQVFRQDGAGAKGIEGLKTSNFLFLSATQSVVQGQLYQRILDHIPDFEVRKLAHPGLVVRRITPQVILQVLRVPCDLNVPDLNAATDLFDRLRNQVDLVTAEPDGTLVHRADVRETMLRLLQQTRPDQVKDIHKAAVEYYHKQSGAVARSEELYHLLQLESDRATLDAAWSDEAGQLVMSSREELPPRGQAYLALRTNTDIPPEIRALADQDEWEQITEGKVRELIRLGGIVTAQMMLAERKERNPGSALYSLEALVLMSQQNYKDAEALLTRGIESVKAAEQYLFLLEMVRVRGDLYAQTGRIPLATADYKRAEEIALQLGKFLTRLLIVLQRLKTDHNPTNPAPPTESDKEYMKSVLTAVQDSDLLAARGQLSGLFLMLGMDYPVLLKRGLRVFSLQSIPAERIRAFPELTAIALNATGPGREFVRKASAELSVPFEENVLLQSAAPWRDLVTQAISKDRLNDFADRVLALSPTDKPLLLWIAEILETAIAPNVQPLDTYRVQGVSHA